MDDVEARQPADWFALDDDGAGWPKQHRKRLVVCDANVGLSVRRCLRDLLVSVLSQPASFSANGSSRLEVARGLYCGSFVSVRRYLRIVLRDRPVRLAISLMDSCSRSAQRLMTLSVATSIIPVLLPQIAAGLG